MSPRAACRLQRLGFSQVYDYVASKVDWLAHNLPTEGTLADRPTAGSRLRADVVTAGPDERVRDVRTRVEGSGYDFALVVEDDATLIGRLRRSVLEADPDVAAAAVMEAGPSTIRPHQPLEETAAQLRQLGHTTRLVTDPEGRLLGVVHRDDLDL
jgi:CBS domain-containing protein